MRYLQNSKEIRKQIRNLFSTPGRKWAVVGFVGYNAVDYLPNNPKGVSVVCWPKAGGTNPHGVRRLIDAGVQVHFCDRLHQKIYWAEKVGLVIGSANLSDNALADDRLHEFGVYCDDDEFDINCVLDRLKLRPVTEEGLAKLDVEHAALARKQQLNSKKRELSLPTFIEAIATKYPRRWKLVTWSEMRDDSSEIKDEVLAHFGTKRWAADNDAESGTCQVGDFAMQVQINDDGIIERANGRWFLVDHVVKMKNYDVVVQLSKLDDRTPPPFTIDTQFKKHFKKVCNDAESWDEVLTKAGVAKASFLKAIRNLYLVEP